MSSIGRVSVSSARNSKRPNETNIRVDKNVSSGDQHNEAPAPFQGMSRIPCGWSLPLSSAIHLLAWPSRRPALGVTRRPSDRPLLITIVRRTDGEGANRAAAAAINRRPDKVLIVARCPLSEGRQERPLPSLPGVGVGDCLSSSMAAGRATRASDFQSPPEQSGGRRGGAAPDGKRTATE